MIRKVSKLYRYWINLIVLNYSIYFYFDSKSKSSYIQIATTELVQINERDNWNHDQSLLYSFQFHSYHQECAMLMVRINNNSWNMNKLWGWGVMKIQLS